MYRSWQRLQSESRFIHLLRANVTFKKKKKKKERKGKGTRKNVQLKNSSLLEEVPCETLFIIAAESKPGLQHHAKLFTSVRFSCEIAARFTQLRLQFDSFSGGLLKWDNT